MIKKEKVHWKRTFGVYKEMDDIGGKMISFPIIIVLISLFHYCFAGMHLLFECTLFFTNKTRFRHNMAISHKKADKMIKECLTAQRVTEKDLQIVSV